MVWAPEDGQNLSFMPQKPRIGQDSSDRRAAMFGTCMVLSTQRGCCCTTATRSLTVSSLISEAS
ncbi:hypothetical protein D9M69_345030 [compost metagenome]